MTRKLAETQRIEKTKVGKGLITCHFVFFTSPPKHVDRNEAVKRSISPL